MTYLYSAISGTWTTNYTLTSEISSHAQNEAICKHAKKNSCTHGLALISLLLVHAGHTIACYLSLPLFFFFSLRMLLWGHSSESDSGFKDGNFRSQYNNSYGNQEELKHT